jgi:DNA-binding response OmpR family regulator
LVLGDGVVREDRAEFLRATGYRVHTFDELASVEAFSANRPDLAVLDITPTSESDGLWLCSEIRAKWSQLPVLVLSSRTSEEDRIAGLRAGADDYIPADVSLRLLGARLEALLERYAALRDQALADVISIGSLRIDSRRSEVSWGAQPVPLSFASYRVVTELATNAPAPKTPEELMHATHSHVERNTVAARIRGIRLRFREVDPCFNNIRTERGHGYRWVP